jgi:hypothetical protein
MSTKVEITHEELDRLVDEGKEDVLHYFDLDNLRRGDSKRINIDMPIPFLAALDLEAGHRGITRQSLIKTWLYDRLMTDLTSSVGSSKGSQIVDQAVAQSKEAADLLSSIRARSQHAERVRSVKRKVQSQGAEGDRPVKRKVSARK